MHTSIPTRFLLLGTICAMLFILTACPEEDEESKERDRLCSDYCGLVVANCTGDNEVFRTISDCKAECVNYPITGEPDARKGDSVQCRTYHAGAPAKADPTTHCPHATPSGGGICTDVLQPTRCEQYCAQMDEQCDQIFADVNACLTACDTYVPGTQGERTNDTLECRLTFLFTKDDTKSPAQICEDASTNSTVCVKPDVDGDQ